VGIPIPKYAIAHLPTIELENIQTYYYFTLIVVSVAALVLRIIVNSRFGHVLRAIRDNRERPSFLAST